MIKLENSVTAYKKIVFLRLASESLLILLLQYISIISDSSNQSVIWLSSGTAIAFIFLRGYSALIGLTLGTLAGFFVQGGNFFEALKLSSLLISQTILLYYFTQHYIYPSLVFHTRLQFIKFVILVFIICLMFTYLMTDIHLLSQALTANMNGIFIIGFSFTYLDAYFPEIAKLTLLNWPRVILVLFLTLISTLCLNLMPSAISSIYTSLSFFLFINISLFFTLKQ